MASLFRRLRRKPKFDDAAKQALVEALADMLELQRSVVSNHPIEKEGRVNRKALGYIYGFVDAALTSIGQDMSDIDVGIPITFQVLRRLFPGKETEYVDLLRRTIRSDEVLAIGMMHGGQQYLDYGRSDRQNVPMGFARFLLDEEFGEEASPPA